MASLRIRHWRGAASSLTFDPTPPCSSPALGPGQAKESDTMADISHAVGYEIPVHGLQGIVHRIRTAVRAVWSEFATRIAEERRDLTLRRDLERLSPRLLRDIGYDV